MKVIRLRSYSDSIEANIARAKLQSEKIACFLSNENFSILQPDISGQMSGAIDLMIREEDIKVAIQILNVEQGSVYTCPYCKSEKIIIRYGKNLLSHLFRQIFKPIPKEESEYYCLNCKKKFSHPNEND